MMDKKFKLSLFIFRRDLRLEDNTGLIAALRESSHVIPCFIFDERQVDKKQNLYFSEPAFQFMLESLQDLEQQIEKENGRLYFFSGIAEHCVEKLLKQLPIDAVFFNRDYTPFSVMRDKNIKNAAIKLNRSCFSFADCLLHEPEEVMKNDGSSYTIYTPFMRKSREFIISKPQHNRSFHFYTQPIAQEDKSFLKNHLYSRLMRGGRSIGKEYLKKISGLKNYSLDRDFPAKNATSHLSPHHKFGTISVRETAQTIKNLLGESILLNELLWRDFFTHIGFHFPHVFTESFHSKYRDIKWSENKDHFKKWCEGKTGFPIVDAGMRELNETGLMHNRVRMITASFLVKDLHINWQWGERYFAQRLMDYDPAVNNGNWQWAASTGCDAQPYFRIFNPHLQQKRFDPDHVYCRHWIPDLESNGYPKPIVNHAVCAQIAKSLYNKS